MKCLVQVCCVIIRSLLRTRVCFAVMFSVVVELREHVTTIRFHADLPCLISTIKKKYVTCYHRIYVQTILHNIAIDLAYY